MLASMISPRVRPVAAMALSAAAPAMRPASWMEASAWSRRLSDSEPAFHEEQGGRGVCEEHHVNEANSLNLS